MKDVAFVLTHSAKRGGKSWTASLQALAIMRSLGRKGVQVVRIHPDHFEYSLLSKYCSKVEICPSQYDSEERLVNFLIELSKQYSGKKILFPASDDTAQFLSSHSGHLGNYYSLVVANNDAMEKILDKKRQYEQCNMLSLPYPETYYPKGIEEINYLSEKLKNYPYIIKPNVAHNWRLPEFKEKLNNISSNVVKGIKVFNKEELINICKQVLEVDNDIMLQEIIQGDDRNLYTFIGYFNKDSLPVTYCVRSKIRQNPVKFGYCTLTESCKNDIVVDQSIRLLKSIQYEGLVGVEWKLDPRTGQYKLIEINARAVNTSGIAPGCGADIFYAAYLDHMNMPVKQSTEWEYGVKWIWFGQDIWAVRELMQAKELTVWQWLKSVSGKKVHALYAADDLRPWLNYYKDFFQNLFAEKINRLIRG